MLSTKFFCNHICTVRIGDMQKQKKQRARYTEHKSKTAFEIYRTLVENCA